MYSDKETKPPMAQIGRKKMDIYICYTLAVGLTLVVLTSIMEHMAKASRNTRLRVRYHKVFHEMVEKGIISGYVWNLYEQSNDEFLMLESIVEILDSALEGKNGIH